MTTIIDSLVSLSGPLVYIIIGLLAFSEAAAFVGLVLPGETALFLGGVIASQGHVNLGIMLGVAVVAAIAGDSVGYEIGRRFGPNLKNSRAGRFVGADKWAKGEQFLARRGGTAVLLGRWVGLLRALVPAIAGMARMPYKTFLLYNSIGGTVWAVTVVLLGYFAGQSYKTVEQYLGKASLILTLVLAGGLLIALIARFALRNPRWTRTKVEKLKALPAISALTPVPDTTPESDKRAGEHQSSSEFPMQPDPQTYPQIVGKSPSPSLESFHGGKKTRIVLVTGFLALVMGYSFFSGTSAGVQVLAGVNTPVRRWFLEHQDDEFTVLMQAVTILGHPAVALLALGICAVIARRGPVLRPGQFALYLGGGVVLATILGAVVSTVMPDAGASQHGLSLASPAGQTLISAALLTGSAWLLISRPAMRWRTVVLILAALAAITPLIALSHAYLAQQDPVDVTLGWLLGTVFAVALILSWPTRPTLIRADD
ncbi:DedA family protein [Arthrobacter sp. B1805]|uniref:DedA family protein n=1 Tax=Arthrobacter sp. B1805 TaxID=2058892 RepID=UPI000CE47D0A|nr:DedA family protein [Arthrobacter sp. B1805]